MSAFGTGGIPENIMMALTTQEKKVLSFLIIMVGLGLVMLAVKKTANPPAQTGSSASAVGANTDKIR